MRIDNIAPPDVVGEEGDVDRVRLAIEELTLDGRRQDHHHRDKYAKIAYGIMKTWVVFLRLVTLGQMALGHFGFGLGEPEFIAVVTTTTASVFGFGFIVGNYLFPKR